MGVQACRLPTLKCLKRSKPLKPLKPLKGHINGTPRPDPLLFLGGPACRSPGICSQRAPKATSMASYGRPAQAKATPRPDPVLFLGGPACRSPGIRSQRASQGHMNGFLWASSAGKSYPKARSIAFSGRSSVPLARHSQPTGIPRPHPWLFMGVQACRLPALKHLKRSKRLKPLQGHINGFLWASSAGKLNPRPDPLLFLAGPACRWPGIRSQQASQGHINGFFWASKPAVCHALNASKASNRYVHQWLLMGFQRRQKLPQGQIHCFFHPKATSMASSGHPSLPFATP